MAAGNNAQLMVAAYQSSSDNKVLALAAAAVQTGGRVVCIIPRQEHLHISRQILGVESNHGIEFVVGEADKLLKTQYRESDFVMIDCNLESHVAVLEAVRSIRNNQHARATVVVGFNAMSKRSSAGWSGGSTTHLLPIGKGLMVTKVAPAAESGGGDRRRWRRSQWVVKVDKCTGEEHVFRVRLPQGKVIQA